VPQIVGESTEGNNTLQRVALLPETPFTHVHPWMRGELAVAVTEEEGVIGIVWDALDAGLPIGGKASAKVNVRRTEKAKGTIRLALVTSQVVPKAKDGKDDVNRAIRLEGTPTVTGEQTATEVKVLVPGDLPPLPYDVALRAELLSPDGKMVLASAVTPARRLLAAK
jgi:hypothetical protein